MSGQQHAPAALYPLERPGIHFYRRLGGPQGRSGRAENLVPNGIRSRTVEPVAQLLYRLSYRAQQYFNAKIKILVYKRYIFRLLIVL